MREDGFFNMPSEFEMFIDSGRGFVQVGSSNNNVFLVFFSNNNVFFSETFPLKLSHNNSRKLNLKNKATWKLKIILTCWKVDTHNILVQNFLRLLFHSRIQRKLWTRSACDYGVLFCFSSLQIRYRPIIQCHIWTGNQHQKANILTQEKRVDKCQQLRR